MNQDFRILSTSSLSGNVVDEDLYFLMQHYGMPTRLLDWSTSALTALYFATDDVGSLGADDKNGMVWIMNSFRLSETQKDNHGYDVPEGFNGVATARNPV